MSKHIPQKPKTLKQSKPKLKVLVTVGEESFYVNEFDAFQMISDLTARVSNLELQLKGIIDAMNAATNTTPTVQSSAPTKVDINLPKLNKVETAGLNDGKKFYGYGADEVKLES